MLLGHSIGNCPNEYTKCYHCGDEHEAGSRICSRYQREANLLAIQSDKKVSLRRAMQIERAEEEGEMIRSGNYIDISEIKMTVNDKKNMTPWLLDKCLGKNISGKIKSIRSVSSEVFSVEVNSKIQLQEILSLKDLNGKPIEVKKSSRFNSPRGLIYIYEYNLQNFNDYKSKLIERLPINDVIMASWIKSRNPRALPLILSFNQTEIPTFIKILGEQALTKVYEYQDMPMMCKQCLDFGHTKKWCKNQPRCLRCCSEEHLMGDCSSSEPKCHHCEDAHFTGNKKCRVMKLEMEIIAIQKKRRVPRQQAKLIFQKENPNYDNLDFAKAAKTNPTSNTPSSPMQPVIDFSQQNDARRMQSPSSTMTEIFEDDLTATKRIYEEVPEETDDNIDQTNYENQLRNSSMPNQSNKEKKKRTKKNTK